MKTIINRINWHHDAIVNGGSTILDCIKVEINSLFKREIFDI